MHSLRHPVQNSRGDRVVTARNRLLGRRILRVGNPSNLAGALVEADMKRVFYHSPGTVHELQTWPS